MTDDLTDYERGAADMRERAVLGIRRSALLLAERGGKKYCLTIAALSEAAKHIEALPLTPKDPATEADGGLTDEQTGQSDEPRH